MSDSGGGDWIVEGEGERGEKREQSRPEKSSSAHLITLAPRDFGINAEIKVRTRIMAACDCDDKVWKWGGHENGDGVCFIVTVH